LRSVWEESDSLFSDLVDECQKAMALQKTSEPTPDVLKTALKDAGLSGKTGKAKRQMLARLKDRFFGLWHSEPKTDKGRSRLSAALVDYLEFLATLVGSIGSFLKSMGIDVQALFESLKELLDLIKQMAKLRAKRGY
jgi:phage-related minor tail protein